MAYWRWEEGEMELGPKPLAMFTDQGEGASFDTKAGTTMSYVVDNLSAEEELIYRASLHWIIFVSPLFWFALGLFGSAISLRLASDLAPLYGSIAILLFSVWKLVAAYIRLFTSEICLRVSA